MFWLWGIAYFVVDGLLVAGLITLLCRVDRKAPVWLEPYLPFRGRWLWYFLIALDAVCLLNTGWLFWMFARHLH
jgi:hypothetical protein